MTDEYELLPAEELAKLRKEVEHLKANPLGGTEENKTLLQSVDQLTTSINKLIRVYGDIKQDMMDEYEKVKAVDEQFVDLKEQNKKIATGVLTVAKMLQDHHESVHEDHLETPSFSDERPLQQQVNQPAPTTPTPQTPPSPEQPPAFSTLPEDQARPVPPQPEQQSPMMPPAPANPNDPFTQAMVANQPQATPVDPWAPQTQQAPPQPEQQPIAPTSPPPPPEQPPSYSMPPPPGAPTDGLGMPPPPPDKKKRGLFS